MQGATSALKEPWKIILISRKGVKIDTMHHAGSNCKVDVSNVFLQLYQ